MKQDVIEANRDRDLYLVDWRYDNVVFIPKGWCDEFTVANGFAGGPDDKDEPAIYAYGPTHSKNDSEVETLFFEIVELQEMEEVSETAARRIHPALFCHLDTLARSNEEQPTVLKVVQCEDHGHNAVFIDGSLVFSHDYEVESLLIVAKHLKWKIEHEVVDSDEYERRFS